MVIFVLMAVVILVRPAGLFGRAELGMTDKLMPTAALDASLEPSRVSRRTTTIRRLVLLAIGLVAAFGLPWFVYPPVAMDIAAWALFAISVDLLLGYTGLLSFGHAAFWGSSAYVTGLIALHFGRAVPGRDHRRHDLRHAHRHPDRLPVGAPGRNLLRHGHPRVRADDLLRGQPVATTSPAARTGCRASRRTFFGIETVETQAFYFYYAAIVMILLGMWAAWRIVHSPFGRVLVAIRDNPARARALGYDVERYKLMVFVLSAGLAGLAGGVFSISHGFASLQELDWTTSGKVVLMTVLGGIGTLWGGPVGAALVVMLEDRLASSGFEGVGIITGGIFIICVLLFRRGIWGTARDLLLWARIKFAPGRKTAPPDEDATPVAARADPGQ